MLFWTNEDHEAVIWLLFDKKTDVNTSNRKYDMTLKTAVFCDHVETAQLLLKIFTMICQSFALKKWKINIIKNVNYK